MSNSIYELFKYCFKDLDIKNQEIFRDLYFGLKRRRLRQGSLTGLPGAGQDLLILFYLFFWIWYNTNIGKSYLIGGEENGYQAKRKVTSDSAGRNC